MIASIRFAGELSPVLVIGFALVAATLVIWLYSRETAGLDSPYCYLLPGLRASAVALVILILAGPVWHRRQVIGTLGRVVFAIDTSQSMSVTDSGETDSTPSRLRRVARLLTGDDQQSGWLESLSETHAVDVVAFSSGDPAIVWTNRDEEPPPTTLDLAAEGERTDLSAGLSYTMASLTPDENVDQPPENAQRAAVVLFSDGRDNIGSSPVDIAGELQIAGVGIHAVGMGSQDEPADVGIVSIIRPDSVASDGQLAGELLVKQFGMTGQAIQVRIESGGKPVWQKTLDVVVDGQQTIPFNLPVKPIVEALRGDSPRGVNRSTVVMDLRAVVEPLNGDTTSDNNSMPFRVAASTRDRKLLILDGSSRWEVRYLRNLFERDPAWEVDTVLFGAGTDMPNVIRGDEAGELPDSKEAMARYDAIILGEVPPEEFDQADAFRLNEFVTRGGGVIVIEGHYGRLRPLVATTLAELVPVEYLDDAAELKVLNVRPTRMGLDHPVMNLIGEGADVAKFWEALPAPRAAARVRAKEGAEVWANAVGESGQQWPWLVTRLFGSGRVFYVSADQTWRWRYKVADRFHARFWNQLLAAVMQPPYSASDSYVAIGTDKIEYESGDSSVVRVRLQDARGKPVGDATVDALLVTGDRVIATVPLVVDDAARGTYQGQTPPLASGSYDVRVRASGFDAAALQATTPIWVGSTDTVELRRVSLDENALVQVAETGGGQYFHESSADELLELLRPLSSGTVVESDILVWQSFYWFWAVILLLTLEWWMRKRAGLV